MKRSTANALLLLAGAVWGLGFVAQSTGMDHLGPFSFVAIRFTIASLVVWPFALWEGSKTTQPIENKGSTFLRFTIIGVAFFFGMAAQQVGLLTTSVSNSGFLTGLYVVFTPLVAVVFFRDWPHWVIWPASLVAMAGIFLLSGGSFSALVAGDFLTILSAFFWAVQAVLIGRWVGKSGRPILLAAWQFSVLAVCAWVVTLILGESITLEGIRGAAPELIYTGVFAGGFAFTLQVIGQRHTSASQAVIFLASEAPFAAIFAAIALNERIGVMGIAGCVSILLAMLMVELVPSWAARAVPVTDSSKENAS